MIRPYQPDDLHACAEVFRAAFAAEPWHEDWSLRLAETRIAELMGAPYSAGRVYEQDGVLLGIMAGRRLSYLTGTEYMIDEFCIAPQMQGRGIGSAMLAHVKHVLSAEGAAKIVLLTTRGFPSERFYLKNGFQRCPEMIFMQLPLTAD
ncbi:MAG: GNAT family N-acetyltransferase [Oscillospiraceae bacterium]|nr:GNAT family N-acetyltransferase [Oscillospiraceae bacterium]